jgi:precorrin-6B methylase 2
MMWWEPSDPNDEIKPSVWMHPAAVMYLESLLNYEMYVLEHGCGGSTLWLAERVGFVQSFDDDADWVNSISRKAPANVTVKVYQDVPYIANPVDLLFIDGNNHRRPMWIDEAPNLVKRGGVVVVDNSNREHYQAALGRLLSACHAPTIVTAWTDYGKRVETAFYRLKGGESWI